MYSQQKKNHRIGGRFSNNYQNYSDQSWNDCRQDEIDENPGPDFASHAQLETSDCNDERRNDQRNDDAPQHLKEKAARQFDVVHLQKQNKKSNCLNLLNCELMDSCGIKLMWIYKFLQKHRLFELLFSLFHEKTVSVFYVQKIWQWFINCLVSS